MILVVDDFLNGAEMLCRLLKRKGYPCLSAAGGPDALGIIRAHPREQPLLVILNSSS